LFEKINLSLHLVITVIASASSRLQSYLVKTNIVSLKNTS
jgi:hypothetical protein